jgi:hypothetical protein
MVAQRWLAGWLVLLALWMTACGGGPRMIGGAERAADGPRLLTEGQQPPANVLVVHNAYLEMEVRRTDAAVAEAERIALNQGGYLVRAQNWTEEGRQHATVTVAVPVARYDEARQALRALGTVLSESVTGDLLPISTDNPEWTTYSHLTVQLRPSARAVFSSPLTVTTMWRPMQTFREAWGVFASIFLFLLDIVIWLVVVVGPFLLVGLGIRALWLRQRRT